MFFRNFLAFSMLVIWFLVLLPFLNPTWTSGSSRFTYCWSLAWRILSITLLVCEMSTSSGSVPNATFRGLRQACVWFPQVLGPHPEETNIGEEIWGVCVCVCVCVQSLLLISHRCVSFAPIHCGLMEREGFAAWSEALFKIHSYDEHKCGRGGRQTDSRKFIHSSRVWYCTVAQLEVVLTPGNIWQCPEVFWGCQKDWGEVWAPSRSQDGGQRCY